MDLFEEIQGIICEQLKVKPEEVRREISLIEDLFVDSLDTVELMMVLEEKFNIEMTDEDAEKMEKVGDAIKYVAKKTKRDLDVLNE